MADSVVLDTSRGASEVFMNGMSATQYCPARPGAHGRRGRHSCERRRQHDARMTGVPRTIRAAMLHNHAPGPRDRSSSSPSSSPSAGAGGSCGGCPRRRRSARRRCERGRRFGHERICVLLAADGPQHRHAPRRQREPPGGPQPLALDGECRQSAIGMGEPVATHARGPRASRVKGSAIRSGARSISATSSAPSAGERRCMLASSWTERGTASSANCGPTEENGDPSGAPAL